MSWVDVGAVGDFPAGRSTVLTVDDREVGVVHWKGEFFALRNVCPHLGAPACKGALWPLLTHADPANNELKVEHGRPVIACPWHHWEFDLRSGQGIVGRERLKTYPVEVQDGRVMVDLGAKRAARQPAMA